MRLTPEERKSLTAMILAVPLQDWKLCGQYLKSDGYAAIHATDVFVYATTVNGVRVDLTHRMYWWWNYHQNAPHFGGPISSGSVEFNGEIVLEEFFLVEFGSLVGQLRAKFKLLTLPERKQKEQAEKSAKEAAEETRRKKKLWGKLGIKE